MSFTSMNYLKIRFEAKRREIPVHKECSGDFFYREPIIRLYESKKEISMKRFFHDNIGVIAVVVFAIIVGVTTDWDKVFGVKAPKAVSTQQAK